MVNLSPWRFVFISLVILFVNLMEYHLGYIKHYSEVERLRDMAA